MLQRQLRGNERAAVLCGLHDHNAVGQGADDAIAGGEMSCVRRRPRWIFREQTALLQDPGKEGLILLRVDQIHSGAEHAHHKAAPFQRASRRLRVHALGHARDDHAAGAGNLPAEAVGVTCTATLKTYEVTVEDCVADTVGGLIMEREEVIPRPGTSLALDDGTRLVVKRMSGRRVRTVEIIPPEAQTETPQENTDDNEKPMKQEVAP